MTEGKFLPCESESPGFLRFPRNRSLIRGPLMSCFTAHQLAELYPRGVVPKSFPLGVISSGLLDEMCTSSLANGSLYLT